MAEKITSHNELDVYRRSVEAAMEIFGHTKGFPREELYSLTDQIRRSSRSVSANLAEAWRKRRYPAAFVSKLSDSEAEAAETQTWIEYSVKCGYLNREIGTKLFQQYDAILRTIVGMICHPDSWVLPGPNK